MNEAIELLHLELNKIDRFEKTVTEKLASYIDLLLEANKLTNLTSITDFHEALFKHIYDSLIIGNRPEFLQSNSIIDIGSGAGIPAIPIAISQPQKHITMLEATQKKVNFQIHAAQILNLENTTSLWGRAEEFAHKPDYRESFDLAIARAVSAANILSELTLPFVKKGGYIIFYKGLDYQNELNQAYTAIQILGGEHVASIRLDLPFNYGTRSLIIIRKTKQTPAIYPRKTGLPQKKPLVK